MIEFRALGSIDLGAGDNSRPAAILAQPRRLALLAYLATASGGPFHRRDTLLPLFWPELDDSRGRAALSQALHVLRRALGEGVVVLRGNEEIGVDAERLRADVREFERAVQEQRREAALSIYQGDLLPGLHLNSAPEFERWLEDRRAALRSVAVRTAWELSAAAPGAEAVRWARSAMALSPYDEEGVRRLVTLIAEAGDRPGALIAGTQFADRLQRDLELTLSAETVALLERIRSGTGGQVRAASPITPLVVAEAPDSSGGTIVRTPPATQPSRHSRGLLRVTMVALVALLTIYGVRRMVARPAVGVDRIAVLPFVVRGDARLDYLAEGMVDLLSTKLDGLGSVEAVDPSALLAYLRREGETPPGEPDPERGRAVAAHYGAGLFLLGRIVGVGSRIEVSASLYRADGSRESMVSGYAQSEAGLPDLIDELTRQLLVTRLAGPAGRLARLAAVSTDSIEALKAYLEGERLFRSGRYTDARDAFQRAVDADGDFALARYRLSVTGDWTSEDSLRFREARRAVQLSARLTEHDRRLLEARLLLIGGHTDSAEVAYRDLARVYPDDIEALYNLGDVIFHFAPERGRRIAEATAPFERVLFLQPENLEAMGHLMPLAALRGDTAELARLATRSLALLPADADRGVYARLFLAGARQDTAGRDREIAALAEAPDNVVWISSATLADYLGDLPAAVRAAGHLTSAGRGAAARAAGRMQLAHLALARGRWDEARRELDAMAGVAPGAAQLLRASFATLPWVPLASEERRAALAALERWTPQAIPAIGDYFPALSKDDVEAARAFYTGTLIAQSGEAPRPAQFDAPTGIAADYGLGATVRATHALHRGQPAEALEYLDAERGNPAARRYARSAWYTHAYERFLRAEALSRLGRDQEAIDWFNTNSVIFAYSTPYRAPALYRLGELHAARGERELAIAMYQEFVDRWRDADPRFAPALRDAQRRLAELRGGNAR